MVVRSNDVARRTPDMDEREADYRRNATECLAMARAAGNEHVRVTLLAMAQSWLLLANQTAASGRFARVLDGFNDDQMRKH
jgi:hypothetical protein